MIYLAAMKDILVIRAHQNDTWNDKFDKLQAIASLRDIVLHVINGMPSTKTWRNLIDLWKPVGIIIMEGLESDPKPDKRPFARIPFVYLDDARGQTTCSESYVRHDAQAIVKMAFREFVRIGYRHFAYIATDRISHWCEDKRVAYEHLIALGGLQAHVFPAAGFELEVGPETTRQLSSFLASLPNKCGILAVNDALSMHVLAAAKVAGRKVPDELAIIGVDNQSQICEYTEPTLTSIALDFAAAANAALDILVGRPRRRRKSALIPPLRLERRGTTAVFERKDALVEAAIERIRKEACSGLTARQVTAAFPCSRRMAEIRFRAVTGSSILDEILRIRFERVFEVLRSREISISALSDLCGFKSTTLLQRQFKARTGLSIRQWRMSSAATTDFRGADPCDTV